MSCTLPRWFLSWDPHRGSFYVAAIDAVSTETQKVCASLLEFLVLYLLEWPR